MDRTEIADKENGAICLVMFTRGVMLTKMSKMAHFFVFSSDDSKKSVTLWTKYLDLSERFCLALLQNAMDY